jgi:hypothetical protein
VVTTNELVNGSRETRVDTVTVVSRHSGESR